MAPHAQRFVAGKIYVVFNGAQHCPSRDIRVLYAHVPSGFLSVVEGNFFVLIVTRLRSAPFVFGAIRVFVFTACHSPNYSHSAESQLSLELFPSC